MDLGTWRDIAVVWLAFLCFIGMVVPLGVAFFAVMGMNVAITHVSGWLGTARSISHRVRTQTESVTDRVVEPVIATERRATRLSQFVRRLVSGRPQPH